MVELSVRIVGANEALKALRTLEPTVAREVGRKVSGIGAMLVAQVKAQAPKSPPVSGWRGSTNWPAWSPITATSSRRGMNVYVTTSSGSGGIIANMAEYVGNGTQINSESRTGAHLSAMFNERLGPTVPSGKKRRGRLTLQAVKNPETVRGLRNAVEEAVQEVNRRMP